MTPKAILATLTVLAFLTGCQPERKSLPAGLIGVWKSSDPRYAGRFLQFSHDRVTFGTGKGSVSIHTITKIVRMPQADTFHYTITYVNEEGQNYRLAFVYDPARGGVIWFKNQSDILWRKERR